MAQTRHWTKPLKDGRVQFFMQIGREKASGTAPRDFYEELRGAFTSLHGELPAAKQRP